MNIAMDTDICHFYFKGQIFNEQEAQGNEGEGRGSLRRSSNGLSDMDFFYYTCLYN
jgi:hypothetical protein